MPVQVFVDDSGAKGQGRHFVMAALLGHSEDWADFADEWRACLDQSPTIRVFKMREAASCRGQFDGWSESDRDDRLRQLARIINRRAKIVLWSVIDLDAHAQSWALTNSKPRNEPYFWPFHNTILAACFALWDIGWRERFDIIFDEHVIFGPRAKVWYPVIRAVCQHKEPEAYSILPADPMFKTDDEFLPIQAADLFAWCIRRGTNNPEERKFEWLLKEMQSVRQSDYSQYYDLERMQTVSEETKRLASVGAVPDEIVRIYRDIWGSR